MVSIKHYIFLLSLLILVGCNKSEFTLQFDLSENVTDNYNVTYYATDIKDGVTVQAVASVRNGKCELNGYTKKPTLIFITKRKSNVPLVAIVDRRQKLEFSGESDNPLEWKVAGNDINDSLSVWRINNFKVLQDNDADSVNLAVSEYVENHRESKISPILMLCYYHRESNERNYIDLMGSLKGEAKNPMWLSIVGRSDQLYHSYSYPASLESIVMRTAGKAKDTLYINHRDPVFFFFWQNNDDERKEMIDSIKALKRELPDTVLIMADIYMDIDSLIWKNSIKKDSLENIKRFWAPMGIMDNKVQKLKVPALPYYIVFDPEGLQAYRGPDLEEAMKEYRDIFNSTDSLRRKPKK